MKDIQHIIWNHQHPKECGNKELLIIPSLYNGLGSSLHVMSVYLAKALDEDKILAWDDKVDSSIYTWSEGPYCSNKITHEQKEFIQKQETRKHNQIKRSYHNKYSLNKTNGFDCFFDHLTNCSYANYSDYLGLLDQINNSYLPKIIFPIVNRLKIPKNLYYFYWRICAVAYFVRFNDVANEWVKEYEEDYLINPGNNYDVSVHVRHGDKGAEMKLALNEEFVGAIKVIQKILKKDKLNVFLSTEDPATIKWFKENTDYNLSYFDFELQNFNIDQSTNLASVLTRQMLANLKHSLFASFTVGTIGSNWNRLIIELRMATAGYANNYYFEVGDHVCLSLEHCKIINKMFHMNW